ncbi:autophagy-related protein 27 [Gongronella butleri]|nr:autophagy-related protein 27 [Gongronella butleri]
MAHCSTCLLLLLVFLKASLGAQPFCERGFKPASGADYQIDLSKLNKEVQLTQEADTHPSKTSNQWQINVCDALPARKDENDCDTGTYICHRLVYIKNSEEYVAVVQSIAGDFKDSAINANFQLIGDRTDLSQAGTQFSLVLNGGRNEQGQAQSASITLECDPAQDRNAEPSTPALISYQNNVLTLHWKTVHACGYLPSQEPPPNSGNDSSASSSGFWRFLKIIFYLGLIYFVGGAIYNRIVYNARGQDLIIHRDFWLDLPFVIKDHVSRGIDALSSRRRGGSGYVAV